MYFRIYRLWKSWLDHSLKSAVSQHDLRVNSWKRPKYLRNLHTSASIMFFIILKEVDLENVSPSVTWNLKSVGYHIDCRWQISCSRLWESAFPKSNAILWKAKIFLQNLFRFMESTSNFIHFEKEDGRHSECISEITDCGKLG